MGSRLVSRVTRPPGGLRWSPPVLERPPHHSPSHAASCGRPLRPTVHEEAVTLVGGAGHGEPVEGAFVVFFVVIKADSKKVRGENIRISCNCQTLSKGSPHAFPRPFNGPLLWVIWVVL